jgi:hypothetical protein
MVDMGRIARVLVAFGPPVGVFLEMAAFASPLALLPQEAPLELFDGFRPGWEEHWSERPMSDRSTRYEVVEVEGRGSVLRARSEASASAFWRGLSLDPARVNTMSWSWKVAKSLDGNGRERTRRGDDYAARVMILFGSEVLSPDTEAICYVWASEEPVGDVYWNPYADKVATIVLQSGDERSGEWVHERRDFVKDFREAFGRGPETVSAVALMVDTDNTKTVATAWFDDLQID